MSKNLQIYLFYLEVMMIFVTYQDQTGTPRTHRINITECTTTNQLFHKIAVQLKIKKHWVIAKLKNDLITLRIVDNWPLSIYPIKNGSRITLQFLKDPSAIFSPEQTTRQLRKIDQQLQLELEAEEESILSDQQLPPQYLNEYQWTKYLQVNLSRFLNAVRGRSLIQVANILKEEPSAQDQKYLSKMMHKKNKYLVDELGQCGKSAIHWAIHQKDLDMVQFLLIKSCNPNTISLDHYTPLQLAISLKQPAIFQTLISHPKIQINKITNKGTALHLAMREKQSMYIEKLIASGADMEIPDADGKTALKLSTQLKLKILCISNGKHARQQIPYISRGRIYKITSFSYRHKLKLLLVNPFDNQLIVYNEEKQIQNTLKINRIKTAFRLMNKTWMMKKQYTYFEITTGDNIKILLATKNQEITDKWVDVIHKAHAFTSSKYQIKVRLQQQLIESIDDQKNQITLHKRKQNTETKKKKRNLSIFDLKPAQQNQAQQQVVEKPQNQIQQVKIQEFQNHKHTSSILASQVTEQNETDFRQSEILGSIIDPNKFLTPPRKQSHNMIDSFYDSMRLSTIDSKETPIVCYQDFQILRQLGNGSFGKVFLARHQKSQKLYALKVLNKKKLMVKKQLKYAVSQANILKRVDNPFIIKLHFSFQTPTNLYMALDYCPYGDLTQILCDQVRLTQKACRFYVAQLIIAIQYLHKNKIIYRDLKPENILIGKNGFIRLADFGLSKQNNFSMSFCGSPAYLSPEMLEKKGVGFEADIYGIGCVLYQMMVGEPPYFDEDLETLFENIKVGKLKFPSFLSKPAKSLINSLLERNINKRLGSKNFDEIKNHEFFANFNWASLNKMEMNLPTQLVTRFTDNSQMNLQVITEHGFNDSDYDNKNTMINRIKGFTFARDIPLDGQDQ